MGSKYGKGIIDPNTPGYGAGSSDRFNAAFAPLEPKPRGILGSGLDGGDLVNALMQAAAISQGDYGNAAQIGQLIAAPKRDAAKRNADFEDFKRQYDYQLQHAKPVNNDTVADYEFIKQTAGEEAAKTFLQNKADPPQYRQGPDGQFYRIATQPAGGLPQGYDPSEWEVVPGPATQGGAAATPPRTFRPVPRIRR